MFVLYRKWCEAPLRLGVLIVKSSLFIKNFNFEILLPSPTNYPGRDPNQKPLK